jgi:hypothetical protein
MDPTNVADWQAQWRVFASAPFVFAPLGVILVAATWWIKGQINKPYIEALKQTAATEKSNADSQLVAAEKLKNDLIEVFESRLKFAQEKEIELTKQLSALKQDLFQNASSATIEKRTIKMDEALQGLRSANNAIAAIIEPMRNNLGTDGVLTPRGVLEPAKHPLDDT